MISETHTSAPSSNRRHELREQLRNVRKALRRNIVIPEIEHEALVAREKSIAIELAKERKAFRLEQTKAKVEEAVSVTKLEIETEKMQNKQEIADDSKNSSSSQAHMALKEKERIAADIARNNAKKALNRARKEARIAERKAARKETKVTLAESTATSEMSSDLKSEADRALHRQKKRAEKLKNQALARREEFIAARIAWIEAKKETRKATRRANKQSKRKSKQEEKKCSETCESSEDDAHMSASQGVQYLDKKTESTYEFIDKETDVCDLNIHTAFTKDAVILKEVINELDSIAIKESDYALQKSTRMEERKARKREDRKTARLLAKKGNKECSRDEISKEFNEFKEGLSGCDLAHAD